MLLIRTLFIGRTAKAIYKDWVKDLVNVEVEHLRQELTKELEEQGLSLKKFKYALWEDGLPEHDIDCPVLRVWAESYWSWKMHAQNQFLAMLKSLAIVDYIVMLDFNPGASHQTLASIKDRKWL